MCRLRNIASESVTEKCDRRADRQTDRQTTDKVIPMCRYASQATQKRKYAMLRLFHLSYNSKYQGLDMKAQYKTQVFR